MIRTVLLLLAGAVIGLIIGLGLRPAFYGRAHEATSEPALSASKNSQEAGRNMSKTAEQQGQLVLGNITTVPFQELYGVLATKSADEIADVAKQLRDLPPGPITNAKITAFFKAWSHLDALAALKAALDFKTKEAKGAAINAVMDGADPAVASTLAKAINELSPDALPADQKQTFLSSALTKWGQHDPVAAAAFADSLPEKNNFMVGMAYHTIALNWARTDPQSALAWANAHNQGPGGQFVRLGAIDGWWEKDPRAAEDYIANRAGMPEGRQEAAGLASRIFNSDPQRAKDWVAGLNNVKAREIGSSVIANQMTWSDPKGAAEWAATLPDDVRSSALSSAVYQWATADPATTAHWLEGTTGTVRDEALGSYSDAVSDKDPGAGLNWAMTIADATKRDKAVDSIVKSWMGRDATSATAWIQSSALPDETKQRLLAAKPGG